MSEASAEPITAIAAATDFTPCAHLAVEQATLLARDRGAVLHLLHVVEDDNAQGATAARARLAACASELVARHGLDVQAEVRGGPFEIGIARSLASCPAQLLVIGGHDHDWLADTMFGISALKVLENAGVPLLLVRGPLRATFSRLLVAVDFSAQSLRAAVCAAHLFPRAEQVLTHVCSARTEGRMRLDGATEAEIERHRAAQRDEMRVQMDAFVARIGHASDTPVSSELIHGVADYALLEHAERIGADLLVIGRHGEGYLDERLFGSTTKYLLQHAPCDVLLVP